MHIVQRASRYVVWAILASGGCNNAQNADALDTSDIGESDSRGGDDVDIGTAGDTGTDADTDTDGDVDADGDTDGDADADGDNDTDVDSDADTDADTDTDTDVDGDTDSDADSDTDADVDGDTDSDADTVGDGETDTDADGDTDTGVDGDSDTDADTGADGDTETDSDANIDTGNDSDSEEDTSEEDTSMDSESDGGQSYEYQAFFECPSTVEVPADVLPYKSQSFTAVNRIIWEEVFARVDESCISSGCAAADTEGDGYLTECQSADCTTAEGAHIVYFKTVQGSQTSETLTVTLKEGLDTWQSCDLTKKSSSNQAMPGYYSGSTSFSAECVGVIRQDWPSDISISSRDSYQENDCALEDTTSYFANSRCEVLRRSGEFPLSILVTLNGTENFDVVLADTTGNSTYEFQIS